MLVGQVVHISAELLVVVIGTWTFVELVLEKVELSTLNLIAHLGRLVLSMLLCHANGVGVVEPRRIGMEVVGVVVRIKDGRLVLVRLAQHIRLASCAWHQTG